MILNQSQTKLESMPNKPTHTRVSIYPEFTTKSISNYASRFIRNAFKVWFNFLAFSGSADGFVFHTKTKIKKSDYRTDRDNRANNFIHINTIHQIYKMSTRGII